MTHSKNSVADADGQMFQDPDQGDERQPLPGGGAEDAERIATIDWVRRQVATLFRSPERRAEKYLGSSPPTARPMARGASLGAALSSLSRCASSSLFAGNSDKSSGRNHRIAVDRTRPSDGDQGREGCKAKALARTGRRRFRLSRQSSGIGSDTSHRRRT